MEHILEQTAAFVWGYPLVILLVGGGIFFMLYSRFLPFRFLGHAIQILRGKYDNPDDPGQINHFQALSGALAATIGMGNISGVAVAIATGGPGAMFWMWLSAFFGIATKFFTCTLAIMYRGKDSEGIVQGGPMYFIVEGLGKQWKPLATAFAVFGLIGFTPLFQANQMARAVEEVLMEPLGLSQNNELSFRIIFGLIMMTFTALVIFGGVKRIGTVASRLVPMMVVLYVGSVLVVLMTNSARVIPSFMLIFEDAFTAKAALGGAVGSLILTGVRRAAFSNEAGIGTAPMMHGAAKTTEPVREGLVAMMGPAIDTLLICTLTGLTILVSGVWEDTSVSGIKLTALAFDKSIPYVGVYILSACVLIFGFTTIIGLAYYGRKCLSFLIGVKYGAYFNHWYVVLVVIGSIGTLKSIIAIVDIGYGLLAFPTMIGSLLLAPKVLRAAKDYFKQFNT